MSGENIVAVRQPKRGVKRFKRKSLDEADYYGLGEIVYPTMVSSTIDVHSIDKIERFEIDSFNTLFVFQALDEDTEIRVNNVIILCNGYHIRANLSYTIKRRACGNFTGTVSTFTIESAICGNGHGVLLHVAPCVLISVLCVLSERSIDILYMNGVETRVEQDEGMGSL